MNDVVFIADFFADQVPGGGELNNEELIRVLIDMGYKLEKANSHLVSANYIKSNLDKKFIVANFINLNENSKKALVDARYIIYEHDHKYLLSRNPADYPGYVAPKEDIINFEFYKNAAKVVCQSMFHERIVKNNLKTDNIINVAGNLWSEETLRLLEKISAQPKREAYSIMNSNIGHKNAADAIKYCVLTKKKYELVSSLPYHVFLEKLGANDTFLFLPKTPETLSRIVVEARMMGMKVITNERVGATKEKWFKLKGKELIEVFRNKRKEIPAAIIGCF